MGYIDADRIRANIERRKNIAIGMTKARVSGFTHNPALEFAISEYDNLLELVDFLEKEKSKTDTEKLEKEIQSYLESQGVGYGGWIDGWRDEDLREIARHFYKLGQNGW